MGSKNKKPNIRFNDFSDDWQQRKLSDITERVIRKNNDLISNLPLTISAQKGLIAQDDYFNKTVASRDLSNYFLLKNGEFAYNKSYSNGYPFGVVKRLNRYDCGVLSTLYICFKSILINSDFLEVYYETNHWHSEVSKHTAEGARNHGLLNISANNFFSTVVPVPKNDEQIIISSFFEKVDNLITLHQHKIDNLENFKKTFLDKLFPKNNETKPLYRFNGFNNDWNQSHLGKLVDISTGKLDANAMETNGKYDFYTSGISKYQINNFAFLGPAITIAGNGATVGFMHLADGKFNAYQRTYVLTNFNVDRYYLYYEISNKLPRKIAEEARTGNVPYIVMEMLTDLSISLPSKEEDSKIGLLLKELDNIITLHQHKLEHLENLKKYFLNNMFI